MYERSQIEILKKRLAEPRRFIQVLYGPRQVGKTTLVGQLLASYTNPSLFVSADNIRDSASVYIEQQWNLARLRLTQTKASEFLLVIDEVQKIADWSETVKALWDADSLTALNLKVILLGSSRLLLQQGLSESLAGRFESTYLPHWSLTEMQTAFGWNADQFAWFGGYPGSAALIQDESRWKSWVSQSLIESSISRDILMLTRVDKPALMRRLFELGCHYSAQILSFTKIMGQLQDAGNTTTLSHYLRLLDTAGLLAGIEKYSTNILQVKSSSPKWQVHNTAFISAQTDALFQETRSSPGDWGHLVESAVGAHLLNCSKISSLKLNYWRERNEEVDFVLESKGKLIALEVKSGRRQTNAGMGTFLAKHPQARVFLIGDSGLPWQEFLGMNPESLF